LPQKYCSFVLRYRFKLRQIMKIKISDIIAISQKALDDIQRIRLEEAEKKAAEEQSKVFKIEQYRKWNNELEKWSKKYFDLMLDSALEGSSSINLLNINPFGIDYLKLNGFHVFKLDLSEYQNKFEEDYGRLNFLLEDFKIFFKKNPNLVNNSFTFFDLTDLLNNIPKKVGIGDDLDFFHIRSSINNAHSRVDVLNAPSKKINDLNIKIRELDMTVFLLNQCFDKLLAIKSDLANQRINPFLLLNGGEYYGVSWSGGLTDDTDVVHEFRHVLTLQKIISTDGQNLLKYINEKIVENAKQGLFEIVLEDSVIKSIQSSNFFLSKDTLIKIVTHMGFQIKRTNAGFLINWGNTISK